MQNIVFRQYWLLLIVSIVLTVKPLKKYELFETHCRYNKVIVNNILKTMNKESFLTSPLPLDFYFLIMNKRENNIYGHIFHRQLHRVDQYRITSVDMLFIYMVNHTCILLTTTKNPSSFFECYLTAKLKLKPLRKLHYYYHLECSPPHPPLSSVNILKK